MREATARIKINKLLEAAGWRFFAEGGKKLAERSAALLIGAPKPNTLSTQQT